MSNFVLAAKSFFFPALVVSALQYHSHSVVRLEIPEEAETISDKSNSVNFSAVKRSGIGNISYGYLGFAGKIPNQKVIDWNEAVRKLWAKKNNIHNVSNATKKASVEIVEKYSHQRQQKISLKAHVHQVDNQLNMVKKTMYWRGMCDDFRLDPDHCSTVIATANRIDAKALTAYSMTELMPYRNGEQNYQLMNLYMENAGRNFLDVVPALGDPYLSMGRYQFTSYAIGLDKDGYRPANKIGEYAFKFKIPESVISLNGLQNDRAAFFFSTFNVMAMIRKLDKTQLEKYRKFCMNQNEQIVEYIATAHHNPSYARKRAIEWINGNCQKPLITYQGPELKVYSIKTATNYKAITSHV